MIERGLNGNYCQDRARAHFVLATAAEDATARNAHNGLMAHYLDRCVDLADYRNHCPGCDMRELCGMIARLGPFCLTIPDQEVVAAH